MVTSDKIMIVTCGHIFQVISIKDYTIYYFVVQDKITTPCFILYRINRELYKPCVKMKKEITSLLKQSATTLFAYKKKKVYILMGHARDATCMQGGGPRTNMTHACNLVQTRWASEGLMPYDNRV